MPPKRISTSASLAMTQATTFLNTDNTKRNSRPRVTHVVRKCTYKEFMSFQPFYFNGTEGAVGLIRRFKQTESVFSRSNCAEKNKVKFAISTLTEEALFWWNSFAQPMRIEEAYKITWFEFKRLLIKKYCPQTEIKKMEEAITITQRLIKKKNKNYIWGEDQESAFQLLKQKLCEASILALPEANDDFVVYCDASHQDCYSTTSSQPQQKQKSKKSKKRVIEVLQLSDSTHDVADEHVTTTSNDPLFSGSSTRVESSKDAGLGDQEDAPKQGRMIADLDADEGVVLVNETQGRNDQDMFDTSILDDEEVVVEKEVSTTDPVPTAGEVVTTASVEVDFQDSLDDEEDTRNNHEYLNDLEEEYQAIALLAKSKRIFKKGTQRFSSAKATDQTKCHKYGRTGHFARDSFAKSLVPSYQSPFHYKQVYSSMHKPKLRPIEEFEAKYNKVKAKLVVLNSSASPSKSTMVKNKGIIAEAYEWDEEEVSSNDNEMVDVKFLMELAEDNDAVSKEGAINGEWVKISMRKVQTFLKIEDNDDRETYLDYLCIDLNYVEEQILNLLRKHRNLVP
nr:reverse transcriptase domain-containing protein [Tanacetum cinerariifolium]